MKVQEFMKLPFPLSWLFIAGALFLVGYVIVVVYKEDSGRIPLFAVNTALIAASANAVIFFEMLLDQVADTFPDLLAEKKEKVENWIHDWYDNIFWSKKNIMSGFVLGVLIIVARTGEISRMFTSTAGKCYIYFIYFSVGIVAGSMLWCILGIARLMLSLGKGISIRPSIFDTNTSSLRTASSILWKISLVTMLIYVLGISQICFCTIEVDPFSKILISFFGMFIVLYIIIPQINIHKTLLRIKQERLGSLVKQIDKTFDDVAEDATHDNINQLRELFDLQCVVNGKKSWSFGIGELLVLISSVLTPLVLFMLKCKFPVKH
jgi:hypothetical protein